MSRRIPTAPNGATQLGEAAKLNLTWLIYLRWAAVLGQVLTMLYVAIPLTVGLPFGYLVGVMAVEVLSNLWLARWLSRHDTQGPASGGTLERVQVLVMFGDTLLLTVLLFLTGGVANPFSAFFFVHVVMAAVLLRQRWSYVGTVFTCLCLLLLYFFHIPLEELEDRADLRLQGMVIALAMAATITVFFVARVTRALDIRNSQLRAERERQVRNERIEALGTLAAGAAHELASPLSTIAIVAKDVEGRLVREGASEDELADARLVRDEVARCRRILDRMTFEAGEPAGEELVSSTVEDLLARTVEQVPGSSRVDVEVAASASHQDLFLPAEGLAQAMRALVSNALDASLTGQRVLVRAVMTQADLVITVVDRGEGMDTVLVSRALDPFFTTKEPGSGMGLGLFLTRSVIERLGGELGIESAPGVGTTVTVSLPLERLSRPV